jgi:hypothetical protein
VIEIKSEEQGSMQSFASGNENKIQNSNLYSEPVT